MEYRVQFVKNVWLSQKEIDTIQSLKLDYETYQIPKKHGGYRTIEAPSKELMEVQHMLADRLRLHDTEFGMSTSVVGFRRGYSTVTNAKAHLGHSFLLNLDIKDFFPSITIDMVVKAFRFSLRLYEEDAKKLAEVFTYNGHLPQGAPYSPLISNLVCYMLDRKISAYCKRYEATYTRYADDISISWDKKELISCYYDKKDKLVSNSIRKIIESEGFKINDKKTFYSGVNGHKEVTGVIINNKLNTPKDYYYRLRSMTNDCLKHGNEEAAKHYFEKKGIEYDPSKLDEFMSVLKGMMSYYSMVRGNVLTNNERYVNLAKKVNKVLGRNYFIYYDDIDVLTNKAEQGDAEAQYQLGMGYYYSQGLRIDKSKTFFWLKIAAINGHAEAKKELFKHRESFSTPEEKIRWINRCDDFTSDIKANMIYRVYKENSQYNPENIFNHLFDSYQRKESLLCHHLGQCYALGEGCEPNPAMAEEVLQFGASNSNYICKAMLLNHEYFIGNETKAYEMADEIIEEHNKVAKMNKNDKYKYFRNKGFTYYLDGLNMLNKAYVVADKYDVIHKFRELCKTSFDDHEFISLFNRLRMTANNDNTGLANLEIARVYMEGKHVSRNLLLAKDYVNRLLAITDYLPESIKKIVIEYDETIKRELPVQVAPTRIKEGIDIYYLINKTSIPKEIIEDRSEVLESIDDDLPF